MKSAQLALMFLMTTAAGAIAAASAEDQAVYDWYDTLEHPRLNELPWAEFSLEFKFEGQAPDKQQSRGFIGKSSRDGIWIIAPDLRTCFLKVNDPAFHVSPGTFHWEARDLAADMRRVLADLHPEQGDQRQAIFSGWLPQRAQYVVYARTLRALKEEELAAALLAAARRLPLPDLPGLKDPEARFRAALAAEFGSTEMRELMQLVAGLDFANLTGRPPGTAAPRKEIVKKAERIVRLFPGTRAAARAGALADMQRSIMAEEATHPAATDAELAGLPVEEQVAELIVRLRDLQQPAWGNHLPNFFPEVTPHNDTTAHRLAKRGRAAIPQLIGALKDTRPSRSVTLDPDGPDVFTPRQVLTVGDCAERILSHIAGRSFYNHGHPPMTMTEAGKAEETKQAALAWWAQEQKREAGGQ